MQHDHMCLHVVFMTQTQCTLFQLWMTMSSELPSRINYTVKLRRRLWTWHLIVSMSFICKKLGWYQLMLHINFACNIYQIIWCVIGSDGDPYFFGDLEELRKMHTSYTGKQFIKLKQTRYIGCQIRWVTFNYSNLCLLISWHIIWYFLSVC